MRAYLRFSLLGGVIPARLRNLGYKAKAHSVMDGEVLHPLFACSGLGEVRPDRRGVLNPILARASNTGVATTDMPNQPMTSRLNFGLQSFCESLQQMRA